MRTISGLLALALLSACHRGASATADAGPMVVALPNLKADFADALVEHHEHGSVALIVGPDGQARALVKNAEDELVKGKITGQVTFGAGADKKVVPVVVDDAGVVRAAGPALSADVTPVSYALVVDGEPWNGAVELPPAGTAELVASAKLQPDPVTAKVGPHGGVLQIVGPDHLEVVADKEAGEARVYVTDADLHPIDPGDRKITLAFRDADVEVVTLALEPEHHFFVTKLALRDDPSRITVVVHRGGVAHACIVGYSPGAKLVVASPRAPKVKVFVTGPWAWGPSVKVHGHGHGVGHGEWEDDGRVKVDIHGPGIGFGGHGHGGGGGVKVKVR